MEENQSPDKPADETQVESKPADAKEKNFDPAAYARSVVAKQLGLAADAADAKVKDLGKAKTAELVEAGRSGNLARVKELLGA